MIRKIFCAALVALGMTAVVTGCNTEHDTAARTALIGVVMRSEFDQLPVTWVEYGSGDNTIVFVGDSRIEWGNPQDYFTHVINMGRGGTTSASLQYRVPFIQEFQPKVVFVSIGINNYGHFTAFMIPIDLLNFIDGIKNENESIKIIVGAVMPSVNSSGFWGCAINTNSVNDELQKICDTKGVSFLWFREMVADGYLKNEYTIDGIHYNENGYKVYFDVISKEIELLQSDEVRYD